jgi:hypothetical protein
LSGREIGREIGRSLGRSLAARLTSAFHRGGCGGAPRRAPAGESTLRCRQVARLMLLKLVS